MNLKNRLVKIIKSKSFVIICIIVVLIIIYIFVEKSIPKENNKFEKLEEESIIDNEINKEDVQQENIKINDEVIEDIEEKEIQESEEKITEATQSKLEDSANEKIYVYITGEVNNPGVIVLPYGSRISDAIDCAGGVTSNADIMKVNLVYMLQDGMKVNIPSSKELRDNSNFEYITMSSGDEKNDANSNNGKTSLSTFDDKSSKSESAFKISNVNINTATQTELETLPGIGPSLALRIINYRRENGKFTSIEELKNVSGIGDNKYDEIKKYIYV